MRTLTGRRAWVLLALGGLVLGTLLVLDGQPVLGGLVGLGMLAAAWWNRPRRGGESLRHEEVLLMPESEREVVVYWRPGCGYCARLRRTLGELGRRARWVDIWSDEEAAAFVRDVNEGNETVPTVVIDGTAHTNPDPRMVAERLERVDPGPAAG